MWKYNNTDELYHSSDELIHYGVIGMKWGMRKARKAGTTYTYKSYGQKKWQKKVDKLTAKNKTGKKLTKAQNKLGMYTIRDRNRQDYVKKTGAGKTVAKHALLNLQAHGGYNRMRAAGYGRVASIFGGTDITVSKILENHAAKVQYQEQKRNK